MQALASGNQRRMGGVALRAEIAAGTLSVAAAVLDKRAGHLSVERVLTARSRWGKARAAGVCRAVPCSPHRLVRDLTDRQKLAVGTLAELTASRLRAELAVQTIRRAA